jgi:ABC-2 type transport system ATP-binding protein
MTSTPAIDAVDLHKTFGDTRAVRGVTLRVEPGERVGIIGPNGAGKTTTLLMLLGAIDADRGAVSIFGHRLPERRSEAMEEVGFSAGYLPLPDRLRAGEAVEFFAALQGVRHPRAAAATILEELDISHLAGQQTASLSSGQGTLVGMAKALVHRPRLVILDEPTASLDPDVAFRVRDRLARLNRDHATTLLLTSHDMREVDELCDRVIFLREGEVLADGPAAHIVAEAGYSSLEEMFLAEAERLRRERIT